MDCARIAVVPSVRLQKLMRMELLLLLLLLNVAPIAAVSFAVPPPTTTSTSRRGAFGSPTPSPFPAFRNPRTTHPPPPRRIAGLDLRPSSSALSTALYLSAQDVIEAGVSFDTFAPQFLWVLMIAAPRSSLTRRVMGPIHPILALAVVHLGVVLLAASQPGALSQILIFADVFDPFQSQLGGMRRLFEYPNFVAEEWPHVLVWDLFVGRMVWLDGVEREIDTRAALALCNFIGPPGLLIHAANCLVSGKGLPTMCYKEGEDDMGWR